MNKKKLFKIFGPIFLFIFYISFVYGVDVIGDYIKTQITNGIGTNNNKVTFSKIKTTYYINKDNDTILTGDQLRGFYYDNIYGYFRLDWSNNLSENVHISDTNFSNIGSCNKAWKFSGKAYNKYVGFINFNYDSSHFVYYCEDDSKIYGKTYSDNLGAESMDGVKINIIKRDKIEKVDDIQNYYKDNRVIKENTIDSNIKNYKDYNIGGGDWYEIENTNTESNTKENIFWIIK